jgi:hypothetical protein
VGAQRHFFFKSGLAINQFVYRDKCLKKSLIPFLRKYHSHDRYVFWPDLASAHYARTVQDYFNSQRVPFVQRKLNPANVPKCRPIEDYWGILKRKVYEKVRLRNLHSYLCICAQKTQHSCTKRSRCIMIFFNIHMLL